MALDLVSSKGHQAGVIICNCFNQSLEFYELSAKIQGITLDNVAANTTLMYELSSALSKKGIELDPEDMHFLCFPNILNLAVKDIIKLLNVDFDENKRIEFQDLIDDEEDPDSYNSDSDEDEANSEAIFGSTIENIRKTFKKLRKSEQLMNRVKSFCGAGGIKFIRRFWTLIPGGTQHMI